MTEMDIITVVVMAVVIFIFLFIGALLVNELYAMKPQFNAYSPNAGAAIEQAHLVSNNLDYIVPIFIVLGGLLSFGLAYYINSSPVFLPLTLFVLLIVLTCTYVFSQLGSEFMNTAKTATGMDWPLTTIMFNNLFIISVIYAMLMAIALYAKPNTGRG